ncbi:unnamed protein product [marine sediment metagenome]|uniref:Uncharacterized protein n=1 Tax=marine sediment metagenome TaxID=412755 RepID=X1BYG7_9ZZZZ
MRRASRIFLIIGLILLFPLIYTLLALVVSILSFYYINLPWLTLGMILSEKCFFGMVFWGMISLIISVSINGSTFAKDTVGESK